jgi:hypothetical protein
LTVVLPVASISFDNSALETINSAGSGNITISAEKVSKSSLPEAVRDLVPDDAVIVDFTVKNGSTTVSDFNGGIATVSIPYSLPSGVRTAQIVIYYVNDSGNLELVIGKYNPETKTVDFTLSHFSKYVIKINDVKFNAVGSGWYDDTLDFAVQRGLLDNFLTDGNIDPAQSVTREEFLVAYLKANGIKPISTDKLTVAPFADVSGANADYINTAKQLGIVVGVDDAHTQFNPAGVAKRVEFFQIIKNMLDKGLVKTPDVDTGLTVADFSDGAQIATWAIPATNALIKYGLIVGDVKGGGGALGAGGEFTVGTLAVILDRVQ